MKIKYLENGGLEITNESGTVTLSMNEMCSLSYNLRKHDVAEMIVYRIEDFDDWCFEQSKEDVISDKELLDDMTEDAIYNDTNLSGDEDLYCFFEKYLDIKEDE